MSKWKEEVPMEVVINLINTLDIKDLMPIAKLVCGTDYAVRFFKNPNHKMFYKNEESFRKSLRRCLSFGAFEHRKQIIRYFYREGFL